MNETRSRGRRAEVDPYLTERVRRTARSERELVDGERDWHGHAHPLEFDESGFPVPQHRRAVVDRVRQLLGV